MCFSVYAFVIYKNLCGTSITYVDSLKALASYPGHPMFFNVACENVETLNTTLKNMGWPGYEASKAYLTFLGVDIEASTLAAGEGVSFNL